jgi:hypothetical protein
MPTGLEASANRYVKGAGIACAYAFGAGLLLWCMGVAQPIIYICAGLAYFALALQVVLATSSYGTSRTFAAVGAALGFCVLLVVGLDGLFSELALHGIRAGFILRWVS